MSLVLQTWRAIRERDLVELLTHAKNSYMEVSRVEEQIRQCKAYTRDALHGQEQLREIHIPEVQAQFQREEQEIAALEQEIEQLLSTTFGGACGTSLAAYGMLLSVRHGTCFLYVAHESFFKNIAYGCCCTCDVITGAHCYKTNLCSCGQSTFQLFVWPAGVDMSH